MIEQTIGKIQNSDALRARIDSSSFLARQVENGVVVKSKDITKGVEGAITAQVAVGQENWFARKVRRFEEQLGIDARSLTRLRKEL